MARTTLISSLLALASVGFAATPIPNIIPLDVIGAFGGCTVDTSDYNSGGSISVDQWSIKVPKNLIVQFPVVWAPFRKFCEAKAEGYEIQVFGNVVGGQPIAAQIMISPGFSLRSGTGYIDSIDISDGSFKIRGGPKLRLSDPNGKFGKESSLAPFWPVDDENPSITAFSGFPMCIPRSDSDSKCPQSNRPNGATNFAAPDPLSMVPFRVGDYITFSGLPVGGEILVYEASATNVQVTTTASSSVPNYIFIEDAIIGITDTPANIEVADSRFIGYLSSCSGASVQVYAIEVDPCTGDENLRQVASATPRNGDARCKWEARVDPSTPFTREYVVKTNNPVVETKDGIQAGQYVVPVTEWIQPEVNIPGTEPVPYKFDDIRGLVQGDFLDGEQFGPLSPFPGPSPSPPSKTCSPNDPSTPATPTASVVAFTATQRGGATLNLVAKNSGSDISNNDLEFKWVQVSPTSGTGVVSITNPSQATATIIAPKPSGTTVAALKFNVTISLKAKPDVKSTAQLSLNVTSVAPDVVTLDTYTWESRQSGTIGVTCHSNVANGDNKKMTLSLSNGARTIAMTSGGGGKWSYSSRSVSQPTNVRCISDLGGQSALVTAPQRRKKRGLLGMTDEMSV